ncbi:universal stress protein [Actinomycetospora straminea]|uniref:UspA domain-containing protein n=1 Tax=Actinomycetospora straminea TaxID=663607 RepID=A0ABP9ELQ1_9PSEU|nr:universal stress protein [Actinomycetospora straminea]MDD7933161.1 universal stress protein [Actinomycetospora straminea]
MTSSLFAAVVAVLWVASGVLAALVLLGRQGYRDLRWYLIGAVLGPLFVPIAAERADRSVRVVDLAHEHPRAVGAPVVVGVDGSPGSDRAVRLAARLFDPARVPVVLVTVLDPDAAGDADDGRRREARALLADRAGWFGAGAEQVVTEVVCGQPARGVETVATARGAALIVLGRHGAGGTPHLLGDVAHRVSRHAAIPVLLAERPDRRPDAGSGEVVGATDTAEGAATSGGGRR